MKSSGKLTILLLGCSTKAGAFVSRQFSRQGHTVIILDWKDLPNKHSRYVDRYINTISPEVNLDAFCNKMFEVIGEHRIEAIVPLHDAALEIAIFVKHRIPGHVRVFGLNPPEVHRFAQNKYDLLVAAQSCGITVPHTRLISKPEELTELKNISFPCIVKPVSSALIKGNRLYTFRVSLAHNEVQLIDLLREMILNIPVMIQEVIEGFGVGYNFFANNGNVINAYFHRRINEHDGVSSYRESLQPDYFGNSDKIEQLVRKIGWTGIGMLEFKKNADDLVLMELNGRFFGSIELSVRSGINLPLQYLAFYSKHQTPERSELTVHTKVRNLHDELQLQLSELFKGKLAQFIRWKMQVIATLFKRKEYIEDNLFDDPKFVAATYLYDLKRLTSKRNEKKFQQKLTVKVLSGSDLRNLKGKLIFICRGNICRSPFAAQLAKKIGLGGKIISAGTFPHENRMSPINALRSAEKFGVDLSTHKSSYLHRSTVDPDDIIVIMDKKNLSELLRENIDSSQIRFISNAEIIDPYRKPEKEFDTVYRQIAQSLQKIHTA